MEKRPGTEPWVLGGCALIRLKAMGLFPGILYPIRLNGSAGHTVHTMVCPIGLNQAS